MGDTSAQSANTILYSEHVIKQEEGLVIGPEELHAPQHYTYTKTRDTNSGARNYVAPTINIANIDVKKEVIDEDTLANDVAQPLSYTDCIGASYNDGRSAQLTQIFAGTAPLNVYEVPIEYNVKQEQINMTLEITPEDEADPDNGSSTFREEPMDNDSDLNESMSNGTATNQLLNILCEKRKKTSRRRVDRNKKERDKLYREQNREKLKQREAERRKRKRYLRSIAGQLTASDINKIEELNSEEIIAAVPQSLSGVGGIPTSSIQRNEQADKPSALQKKRVRQRRYRELNRDKLNQRKAERRRLQNAEIKTELSTSPNIEFTEIIIEPIIDEISTNSQNVAGLGEMQHIVVEVPQQNVRGQSTANVTETLNNCSQLRNKPEELLSSKCINKKPKRKRIWVQDIDKKTDDNCEYIRLCRELESNEDRFYCHFNMSQSSFEELHELLKPHILKMDTNAREAISARQRLFICLRCMRTGDPFLELSRFFRIGRTTTSGIVYQVTKAIWECLQPTYMPTPTLDTWIQCESRFREQFNFPNCIGSLNGKHVIVNMSHRRRFKLKKASSIVFLAIADPSYKFVEIDVGNYGQVTDSNVFENSMLYRNLVHYSFLPTKALPDTHDVVPHVFAGSDAFSLKDNLMRPFPTISSVQEPKKGLYNKRLERVVRVVEDTFSMLIDKWQILGRPLSFSADKSIDLVRAACVLHNYVRVKHSSMLERPEDAIIPSKTMMRLKPTNHRSPNSAMDTRNKFLAYFNK